MNNIIRAIVQKNNQYALLFKNYYMYVRINDVWQTLTLSSPTFTLTLTLIKLCTVVRTNQFYNIIHSIKPILQYLILYISHHRLYLYFSLVLSLSVCVLLRFLYFSCCCSLLLFPWCHYLLMFWLKFKFVLHSANSLFCFIYKCCVTLVLDGPSEITNVSSQYKLKATI